jgi:hypothetical protein
VKDDRVVLDFDSTVSLSGKPGYKVLQEQKTPKKKTPGSRKDDEEIRLPQKTVSENVADTQGGSVTAAVFKIRIYELTELTGKASVFSTRGGVLKDRQFSIRQSDFQKSRK